VKHPSGEKESGTTLAEDKNIIQYGPRFIVRHVPPPPPSQVSSANMFNLSGF